MSSPAPRSRLQELRLARGWTQEDVAEHLVRLAWTRYRQRSGVTADMVSKWERGSKGVGPRNRQLLAALFRVTVDQLGVTGPAGRTAPRPDGQSLIAMIDDAADLLNNLGGAGRALRPQVLAALTDEVLTRRSMIAMLDPVAPAATTPATDAMLADLEALAERFEAAHATVAPAALMTAVSAHIRMVTDAVRAERSAGRRQRLLRNRARTSVLAGRLAAEDLDNVMAAHAYYAQATDDAAELADEALVAVPAGYAAKLAIQEDRPAAALYRIRAVPEPTDPTVRSWLASIEATAHADAGNEPAARQALDRASASLAAIGSPKAIPWFTDHDASRLAAIAGHVLLAADDPTAPDQLADAAARLEHSEPAGLRALVLCLIDQATACLHSGSPAAAFAAATHAADLLCRLPSACATARLRSFRDTLERANSCDAATMRAFNDQLAHLAA